MQADPFPTELQYLLVLDFQATCVEDKKIEPCAEIIEFPVIVVQCATGKTLDVFHQYVRPTINPQLTKFCTELTGITQEMVNPGQTIDLVLQDLQKWFKGLAYLTPDNYTFVTCGDWDLCSCLKHEAKQKQLLIKPFLKHYINIKKYFVKVVEGVKKSMGMMHMLEVLGIKHQGRHHSGIDDVKNICSICIQLIRTHGATYPKKQITHVKFPNPLKGKYPQLQYLLVLDFEATCLANEKIQPCSEIIQFPVVVVSTHQNKVIHEFHHYVKPTLNPQLSPFCTQLTGITQEKVEQGKTLPEVLAALDQQMSEWKQLQPGNYTFVTCGDWDLCKCLRAESKTKNIQIKPYLQDYINLKRYFGLVLKMRGRVGGMMQMLEILGLKAQGKHHSGIDDARNIARVCMQMIHTHKAMFYKNEINHVNY